MSSFVQVFLNGSIIGRTPEHFKRKKDMKSKKFYGIELEQDIHLWRTCVPPGQGGLAPIELLNRAGDWVILSESLKKDYEREGIKFRIIVEMNGEELTEKETLDLAKDLMQRVSCKEFTKQIISYFEKKKYFGNKGKLNEVDG
jgi:hypothetical protein